MTEKPKEFEVTCNKHGVIAIINQAILGLPIISVHMNQDRGCTNMSVRPFDKSISWQQRKQMKRITNSGKR